MSIPDMIRGLPFAVVGEEEANLLALVAKLALEGNADCARAVIDRLNQDMIAHYAAHNFIKGECVSKAIAAFANALPENMS